MAPADSSALQILLNTSDEAVAAEPASFEPQDKRDNAANASSCNEEESLVTSGGSLAAPEDTAALEYFLTVTARDIAEEDAEMDFEGPVSTDDYQACPLLQVIVFPRAEKAGAILNAFKEEPAGQEAEVLPSDATEVSSAAQEVAEEHLLSVSVEAVKTWSHADPCQNASSQQHTSSSSLTESPSTWTGNWGAQSHPPDSLHDGSSSHGGYWAAQSQPPDSLHDGSSSQVGYWGAQSQPHEYYGSFYDGSSAHPGYSMAPEVTDALHAFRDLFVSGLNCGRHIDYKQLFLKVTTGEVCLSEYYSSKLEEVRQELRLTSNQLVDLGLRKAVPALTSRPQEDLFDLFQRLIPASYVEECLPLEEVTKARWLCYEIVESTEVPAERDIREVWRAMTTYYKVSCFLKKAPCMGIPHEVVGSILSGRKLTKGQVETAAFAHKAFFKHRPYIPELSRYALEQLKDRRFKYVSGKINEQWWESLTANVQQAYLQDQNPGRKAFVGECVHDIERFLMHKDVYPEISRKVQRDKTEARGLRLYHEESELKKLRLSGQWRPQFHR
jgi:hypothetical protein